MRAILLDNFISSLFYWLWIICNSAIPTSKSNLNTAVLERMDWFWFCFRHNSQIVPHCQNSIFKGCVHVFYSSHHNLKATVGCHTLCLLQNRSNFPLQTGDCSWAGRGREGGTERLRKAAFVLSTRFFFYFYHPSSYNSTSWTTAR